MSIETPSTSTATVMKESLASISSLLIEKQKEKIKKQQLIKILEESMENLQFIQNSLEESYNLMNKNLKQIKESNTSSDEDVDDNGENVETLKSLCIVTKNRIKNIENICNKYEEIKSTKSNKNKKQNGKTGELNVNSNNENNENIPNKNVDCTILQSNKNTKETNIVNTELILDETNGEFHSIEKDKSMEKPQETDVMSDSEKENIKNEENVQNVKAKIRLVALEKLLDPNIIKNANERNKSQQITNEPIIIVDDSIVTIDDSNDDNSDDEEDLLPVSSFLPKSKTNSYSNNKINVNSDKKNTAVNEGKKKLIDKNKEKPNKEKFDDAVKEKSKTKNISSSDLNDNHRSSDLINEHSVRKKSSRSCSSRNKISNSVHKINKCRVKIKKNSIFKYMIDNSVNQIRLAKLQILRDKISSNITTESTSTTTTSKKHQRQSKQSSSKSNSTTNKDKKSSEKNKKSSKKFGRIVKRRIMSDSDGSSDIEFENVANTNKTMAQGEKSANSSSQSTSSSSSSSSSSSEDEENSSAKVTDGGCTSMGGLKYKIFLKSNSKSDEQDDLVNDMNGDQNNGEYSGSSKSNERTNKKNKDSSDSEEEENEDEEDENNESSGESEILKRKRKKDDEMNDGDENKLKSNNDDNDILSENDEDDSDDEEKKGKKKRRKRIRPVSGSDSGSDKDSPNKKRKNIRKLLKTKELGSETKLAARQEEERRKRIEERQKIYNVYYEKPENVELKELVLDFDEKTKKPLLKVDEGLLKKLKPHQATGVKFMWDACFETIKDAKKKPGSGCILAHCMGLGKTLQVVTLVHTLLTNNDKTNVERVIVIAPLSTLNNWAREFVQWLKFCKNKNIEIYDMSKWKDKKTRIFKLNEWYEEGGVCILGYDMFRILTSVTGKNKKQREKLQKCLIDPGPDLVVCDEGHLLKNEKTSLSKAVTRMKTLRRIILTGTPLQNNLKEYYCMIQFIKPNLLGTYKEYMNRFVNPITNGQYTDSTEQDIRLMKHRSHVLHKLLEGCIQRRDYSVLAPYLPPKHEYVIFIQLSELQQKLYDLYMTSQKDLIGDQSGKGAKLFQDFCNLRRIWTHPLALKMNADITYKKKLEKALFIDEDEMGSLKDFIDDDEQSASNSSSDSESFNSDKSDLSTNKRGRSTRRTRQNADQSDEEPAEKVDERPPEWWNADCSDEALKDLYESPKLLLLMHILQECEKIGDKILLFSQSLQSLDVIEHFLSLIDRKTSGEEVDANLGSYEGSWTPGLDYFRLDGSRTVDNRDAMCKSFNNPNNLRARLFLISTRAGGLGINLVAANRVIIFDVSWNPSHDTQSIFRVYRFGQNKPCYIYRFIAMGTMEEKIYERQVTKQATAKRVLDEQQISRHYNQSDLLELYNYELKPNKPREIPILPKDRLFADILSEHEKIIYRYHEHDSLLENEESEHLSEEERKAAWDDFEAEKNRPAYQPYIRTNYGGMNGPVTSNRIFGFRSDILLRLLNMKISRDFPEMSEQEVYQHIPLYMNKLYHQIGKQDNTMYNELLELSSKLQVPPSGYFPYPMYQQQPTGMNMQHQSNAMNVQQVNAMNMQQPNAMNIQTAGGTQQNQNTYSLMTHNAQTRLIQQQQQKALQQLQQQKQKSNVASYSLPSTSSSEVYEID